MLLGSRPVQAIGHNLFFQGWRPAPGEPGLGLGGLDEERNAERVQQRLRRIAFTRNARRALMMLRRLLRLRAAVTA